MDLIVLLRRGVRVGHCPRAAALQRQSTTLDAHVSVLTPVLTPAVADNPVETFLWISAPSDHGHDVVLHQRPAPNHPGGVLQQRIGVNAAGDWPSVVDLFHHGILAHDRSIVRNGGVGIFAQSNAGLPEGAASTGDVLGFAARVRILADAIAAFTGACQVWLGGKVGDAAASALAQLVDPLVGAVHGATVARPDIPTVQHVLHGKLDIRALCPTGNLDAIR
mmetsp:Transcript_73967/g.176336  ORF Transcript_73967/g.176336 Transcript_73967/m.176336 type:complete len:221 (+) Transcript_73967:858-1520(+)